MMMLKPLREKEKVVNLDRQTLSLRNLNPLHQNSQKGKKTPTWLYNDTTNNFRSNSSFQIWPSSLPMSNRMRKKMQKKTSYQKTKEEFDDIKEKKRKKKEVYFATNKYELCLSEL